MDESDFRFSEGRLLNELREYIEATYNQHYSRNKFQATEFIIDSGHGIGFAVGNVMKYAQRYGNKDGFNRKDIMKILHYALIMLHTHDYLQSTGLEAIEDGVSENFCVYTEND